MVKLGELLEIADEYNSNGSELPFFGVNKDKQFMPTIANTEGLNSNKYKIIRKNCFVFSGMQTGRDMCIRFALYTDYSPVLLSPAYTILRVKDENIIIPEYLFIYFLSSERDRLGAFYSDASVRANLELYRFFQIEIPLPAIDVQREYVAAYRSLQQLAEQNEALASQIIATYECVLIKIKQQFLSVKIGPYIEKCDKNTDGKFTNVLGIGQNGFISPQKIPNPNLKNYKIMQMDDICYAPPLYNILSGAIHIYKYSTASVCSPIYEVFRVDNRKVIPEYLLIWLQRAEFKRYAEYYSLGVRNTFDFAAMGQVKIPLPPIEVQRSIVALYNCAEEARAIAKEAREQLKILAPAMVQRAANTPVEL